MTRTSYQVGSPWMFDGKMLRGDTGTPMRMTARANSSLALAEPDPLTLANRTTKSFTLSIGMLFRVRHFDQVFLHVPGAGRAALGAQPAMQAHVLVLHHHAAGLQIVGDVEVLGEVRRRRLQARAQIGFLAVLREGDAVHRADVDAGVALDAELAGEHGLHVAVQAALRLREGELVVIAELDLGADVLQRDDVVARRHAVALVDRDVVVVATTRGCPSSG